MGSSLISDLQKVPLHGHRLLCARSPRSALVIFREPFGRGESERVEPFSSCLRDLCEAGAHAWGPEIPEMSGDTLDLILSRLRAEEGGDLVGHANEFFRRHDSDSPGWLHV